MEAYKIDEAGVKHVKIKTINTDVSPAQTSKLLKKSGVQYTTGLAFCAAGIIIISISETILPLLISFLPAILLLLATYNN